MRMRRAGLSASGGPEPRARHADHDRLLALLAGVDHAHHAHDAGDRVQVVDAGILDAGFALGRDDQEAAAAGALERGERLGPADRERHRDAGEDHQVADRRAPEGWRGPRRAPGRRRAGSGARAADRSLRCSTHHPRGWESRASKLIAEGGRSSRPGGRSRRRERLGARDWTRTSMTLRPPDPESGASTNFATRAPRGDYGASFGASISGVP